MKNFHCREGREKGEKRKACCLCTNVLLQNRRRLEKLHGASCSSARNMLQKIMSSFIQQCWDLKNKDALMCSLYENQLKYLKIKKTSTYAIYMYKLDVSNTLSSAFLGRSCK